MENWLLAYTVDLAKGDQAVSVLTPNVLALPGDNLAHTWMITVTRNGVPADLTGATATAYFTRGDGNTVMLVGTAEGNVCAYTMMSTCYAVPGPLRCVLKVFSSTIGTVTLLDKIVQVRQGVGGSIIDPGTAIPSLEQLLAAVPAAEAATLAAQIAGNMGAGLNLHINTGFYADTNGWTLGTNVVRDTSKRIFGAFAVKSDQSGLAADAWRGIITDTPHRIPCEYGDNFTGSVWLFFENAALFDSPIRIEVAIYDASGTRITSASYDYTPVVADQNRWLRISVSRLANVADAASVGIAVSIRRNGRAWIACPKLERYTDGVPSDWRPSWADILALPYLTDWLAPTLQNGWTEISGYPVRYFKDAMGFVHCKGLLAFPASGANVTIFQFPVGYRPGVSRRFTVAHGDSATSIARFKIDAVGAVTCEPTLNTGTWADITVISYKAEA